MKTAVISATAVALFAFEAIASPPSGKSGRPLSFAEAPFVSARIVKDLSTWTADRGDQVLAIDLSSAQGSNRYFGEVQSAARPGPNPYVYSRVAAGSPDERGEEFGYQYVGRTASGVDILRTFANEGGSGVFEELLLVKIEPDRRGSTLRPGAGGAERMSFKRPRLLIRRLGAIGLGDRWEGTLEVKGNRIFIGANTGVLREVEPSKERVITIDPGPY